MRIAALILGIVGGVFGIVTTLIMLAVAGIGPAVQAESTDLVVGLGWAALVFCFLAFLGAGLAMAKPRLGALLLLISAVGITISISVFGVVAAPLFFIAAVLAFLGRRKIERGAASPLSS